MNAVQPTLPFGTAQASTGGAPAIRIAITGRFRTGKDTLADMVYDSLVDDGVTLRADVVRIAFADALKAELSEMVLNYTQLPEYSRNRADDGTPGTYVVRGGYTSHEAQMREDRHINGAGWQWWGEYRRQKFGQDYWVTHPKLIYKFSEAVIQRKHVIITDMRHHNEAQWCKSMGFYLVRVEGPCRADEHRDPNHPSEIHIPELPVHGVIKNDSDLGALRVHAHRLVDLARNHARENQ